MKIVAAFLAGVTVSGIASFFYLDFFIDLERTKYISGVEAPIGGVLQNINRSIKQGDHDLGHRKLALFEELWNEYRGGGMKPDNFMFDITDLADKHLEVVRPADLDFSGKAQRPKEQE